MWLIPPFIEANSDNPGDGLKVTFSFKLKLLPFFCTSEFNIPNYLKVHLQNLIRKTEHQIGSWQSILLSQTPISDENVIKQVFCKKDC